MRSRMALAGQFWIYQDAARLRAVPVAEPCRGHYRFLA